jgi:hypothetical protein
MDEVKLNQWAINKITKELDCWVKTYDEDKLINNNPRNKMTQKQIRNMVGTDLFAICGEYADMILALKTGKLH